MGQYGVYRGGKIRAVTAGLVGHDAAWRAAFRGADRAYDRDGLLHHFPAFAANELLVQELLGMTSYAVENGYYRPERDLTWSRRIDPAALTWEQFLRHSGWRGEAVQFGGAH